MNWPERIAPLQKLDIPEFFGNEIEVSILREDLLDREISGNKWRKLKYNLLQAAQLKHDTVLTFGGAFSNHLAATAAAGAQFGFNTIGVVRGDDDSTNPTLVTCREHGMTLHFVDRSSYRDKHTEEFKAYLHGLFGGFYLVPEGGANYWGVNGCMEILKKEHHSFDYVIGACGTGTMISGILLSAPESMKVIGVSALKGDFMTDEIKKNLQWYLMDDEAVKEYLPLLTIWNDAHFGGYGKCPKELQTFIRSFYDKTNIPLDGIYTGKVVHAVSKQALEGKFESGSKVMIVHSGGIQGNEGLNYRLSAQLPTIAD